MNIEIVREEYKELAKDFFSGKKLKEVMAKLDECKRESRLHNVWHSILINEL